MTQDEPIIRAALHDDLPEIQSIYAHHVLHGAGSFETEPPSLEAMTARFDTVRASNGAWLVATDPSGVLGYAYFERYRDRFAYRFTVEDSVYVRADVRGQGVGKALVGRLVADATARGYRQMIAVIGDSDNVRSIGVHASLGFQRAGILRAIGLKFGRWLDTIYMQRQLGDGDGTVPEPPSLPSDPEAARR